MHSKWQLGLAGSDSKMQQIIRKKNPHFRYVENVKKIYCERIYSVECLIHHSATSHQWYSSKSTVIGAPHHSIVSVPLVVHVHQLEMQRFSNRIYHFWV